jgi:hypothetical protein
LQLYIQANANAFLCILDALPPLAGFFPDMMGETQWKIFAKEQDVRICDRNRA